MNPAPETDAAAAGAAGMPAHRAGTVAIQPAGGAHIAPGHGVQAAAVTAPGGVPANARGVRQLAWEHLCCCLPLAYSAFDMVRRWAPAWFPMRRLMGGAVPTLAAPERLPPEIWQQIAEAVPNGLENRVGSIAATSVAMRRQVLDVTRPKVRASHLMASAWWIGRAASMASTDADLLLVFRRIVAAMDRDPVLKGENRADVLTALANRLAVFSTEGEAAVRLVLEGLETLGLPKHWPAPGADPEEQLNRLRRLDGHKRNLVLLLTRHARFHGISDASAGELANRLHKAIMGLASPAFKATLASRMVLLRWAEQFPAAARTFACRLALQVLEKQQPGMAADAMQVAIRRASLFVQLYADANDRAHDFQRICRLAAQMGPGRQLARTVVELRALVRGLPFVHRAAAHRLLNDIERQSGNAAERSGLVMTSSAAGPLPPA